jgi:vacuolar protein sorting-associated protein VTA1
MFTAPINHQESTAISSHASNQRHSPPQVSNSTSSNHFNISPTQRPAAGWFDPPSETWSTTATSGRDVPNMFVLPNSHSLDATSAAQTARINDSLAKPLNRNTAHTIDAFSGSARGPLKKPAWTNEELEGKFSPSSSSKKSSLKSGSPESDKKVRFSPLPVELGPGVPSPPKSNSPPKEYTGPDSIYATPPPSQARASPPSTITSPSHPTVSHSSVLPPPPPVPSAPPASYIYAPSHSGVTPPAAPPPLPTPDSFELTPDIVAKVQRRCRYAISALDYEDAETARKELRAALILLD